MRKITAYLTRTGKGGETYRGGAEKTKALTTKAADGLGTINDKPRILELYEKR